jgi:hypothetical protein
LTPEKAKNKKGVQNWKFAKSKSGKNHDNTKKITNKNYEYKFPSSNSFEQKITNKFRKQFML